MSGQLSLGTLGGVQLAPDALEDQLGAWCTPEPYADVWAALGVAVTFAARSEQRSLSGEASP